jgi:large repetitive protein
MKARLALAVGCATGLLLALPALPAGAKPVAVGNTYYVNSATDTGAPDCPSANNSDCGIDDAIAAFNNDTTANDSDTIVFSTAVTTFTVGGPTAISNTTTGVTLTITGNGPAATIVSGNKVNRVFQVDPGTTVSISELTIEDGQAPAGTAGPTLGDTSSLEQIDESDATVDVGFNNGGDGGNGGGVDNLGTLSLSDDDVLGNSAGDGGAPGPVGLEYIGNDDQIDLADGGTGSAGGNGGGIYNAAGGSLTLTDDAVAQNTAGSGPTNNQDSWTVLLSGDGGAVNFGAMGARAGQGGGIYNAGTLVAQNDTIAGNKSGSAGGFDPSFAVGVAGGDTSVLNFLLPETTGPSGGGGGGIYNTATASVTSATVAGNTTGSGGDESGGFGTTGPAGTGGGLDNAGGDLNLQASIVAESSGNDCAGTITDDGYNIDDDGNCGFTTPSVSDSTTLDSSLGSLAANGGPTSTIALTAGPAVGLVNSASVCALPDQRGVARPTPVCDSGAFELTPVGPTITVTPSTLPNATAEFLYSEQLGGDGGSTPYTFSVTSGPLPSWLTLTSAGLLSGIPPSTTPVSFTVQAKDAGGYTGSQAYTLTIVAPTINVNPAPPIANATWESPYTPVDFGATGGVGPYGFSYSGALPTGLTLSAAGVLAGTPTNKAQIGDVFTFTVTATDQGSFAGTRTGYSIRLGSPCGSGLTPYFLTAKSGTGNFTGIFCTATSGSATYTQYSPTHTVTATGTGTVTVSGSVTHITAFGADLALIGQSAGSFSTFTETAPLRSGGTYTLS